MVIKTIFYGVKKLFVRKYKVNTKLLERFFNNCQMARIIGYGLPTCTRVEIGDFWFKNKVEFHCREFKIEIHKDPRPIFLENVWQLSIYVENIEVYSLRDKWLHDVPVIMKQRLIDIIENEIKSYNVKCYEDSIRDSYNQFVKNEELTAQHKKIEKYQNEKKRLLKVFEDQK
jgi:hypothetical protein